MPKLPFSNRPLREGWRGYQAGLRRGEVARLRWRRTMVWATAIVLLALASVAGLHAFLGDEGRLTGSASPQRSAPELTSKQDVRRLLDAKVFLNPTRKTIELPVEGQVLRVESTIDPDLQEYLLENIDRENSRYVGIVVMEAATGRVLAMAGFDKTDPAGNPCLRSQYPAASIFKIVTAASAVDHCGYAPDSPMHFNGTKHTLYKRQLTDAINRHTNTVSFRDAFAESVNPVFGKIGQLRLGRPLLEQSADAFGFNEPLDFELALPPSHFQVDDQPYHWAEAASGFNLETTISPLHGAVMASAVLNGGRMVAPAIVDRIADGEGRVLYRWQPAPAQQAMSPRAAAVLGQLMETTVTSGTGRKAFRNLRRDKVLSRLEIGGKTGSIGSQSHDLRYDWFVGFARERHGQRQMIVSVMVAHEEYIGTRATEYARMAITRFFGAHSRPNPAQPTL